MHKTGSCLVFSTCRKNFSFYGCIGNIDFDQRAENDTRKALRSVIGSSDVFYDIGAHGGVYSLTLKDAVPELDVHSFEPLPEELIVNFGLNSRSIQNVHKVAVGDTHGGSQNDNDILLKQSHRDGR